MANAVNDFQVNGAAVNGGDPVDLDTASVELLCIVECEAVWEITIEAEVEEC